MDFNTGLGQMKSEKYLPALQKINSVREKRVTRGERILSALFPNRGVGFPGGWQSDRLEHVQHLKHWTYVAIHTIASKIASITPNLAYVTDAPKPGHTTKVCNRSPYQFGGESFISEGGHSFLTMGAYRSKSLSVVKPHEELEPLESYHPLRRLFENPNPVDTFFDLAYELQMFDELCGVNYLWAVPNAAGVPCELWVIPSHWVWPRTGGSGLGSYVDPERPDAGRLIQYYEIRPWGGMGSAGVLRLPPEEVIMSAWKSPLNKIDGYSKLYAVAQWIDSEESISKSRWSQFQNQARPEFWVELGAGYEDPDDDRISRMEAKFAAKIQGEYNYGKPVITPPGAKITPLSFNPTEMAYHQCLSADTECLTSDGWKKYTDLSTDTEVACYDPDTNTICYSKPSSVYVASYQAPMYHWHSNRVDILTTPDHRMFVHPLNAGGDTLAKDPGWVVKRMSEVADDRLYSVRLAASVDCDNPPDVEIPMYKKYAKGEPAIVGTYKINPSDWARFLGWYVSEGNLAKEEDAGFGEGYKRRRRHRVVAASQKITSEYTPVIDRTVERIPPYSWAKNVCGGKDNKGCYQWYATDRGLYLHIQKHCGAKAPNKRLPRYTMGWPARILRVLLEAAVSGDGKDIGQNLFGWGTRYYRTISWQLAQDIAEVGIKCGFRVSVQGVEGSGYYTVLLSDHAETNVHGRNKSIVDYNGMIWCVTVPTGLFVVRRNGKAHITGNSEEQIRDMILAAFQVPKTAVGISNDMTYGSLLASLSQLCAYCLNPRLSQRGQSLTKHLGSRWDRSSPSYSTLTGGGYGGRSIVKKVRVWYDDCVPADPTQVNADLAEDRANYAVTPNEVRALRGRKAYHAGGDDPIAPGPGGVMPFPLNTGEDLGDIAKLIAPMTQQGQENGQGGMAGMLGGPGGSNSGEPEESGGERPESTLPGGEQVEGEEGLEELGTGGIKEPNGKPSKSYTFSLEKGLREGKVEEFRSQLKGFSPEELDGIRVWYNAGPPELVLIDVMDWGDGEVGKRIGRLASRVVGKDRVVWQNEGATPNEEAGWENLIRGSGLPVSKSKLVSTSSQKDRPNPSLSEKDRPILSPSEETQGHTPTVAVDLDGTLAEYDGWKGEDHFGELRVGAREALEKLRDRGCRIVIFTTRGDIDLVMDWLEENHVPYDYVNENPDQPEGSSGKVIADVYVDDRAVDARPSWDEVYDEVLRRISKGVGRVVIKTSGPHGYSSTQFNLEDAGFIGEVNPLERLIALRGSIKEEDLGGDGREEDLHVTVRYGLHTDDPEEVRGLVKGFGVVKAVLGKVSIFPASEKVRPIPSLSEGGEYDVVKVDVDSPNLHILHELLGVLPHTDTHTTYQPHITLAYVESGRGKRYVGDDSVEGMEVFLGELVFSDRVGNREVIELGDGQSLGVMVRKGRGKPCEPGETAEETGCTPASSLGGKSPSSSGGISDLGKSIKSPSLGSVVTVDGGRYVVESLDGDDSFPPAVAGYELRDGYLFYHGRNGGEGVVSGTKEDMFKWMGDVEQEVRRRPPELEEQRPWTPEMGGEDLVVKARNAGVKAAQLFGVTPLKLDFTQRDATYGEGGSYSAHGSASVVNAHLDLPSAFDFDTPGVTRGMHIASHETMHKVFSTHVDSGRVVIGLMSGVEPVSLYGAVAGSLESLMELGAAYVTAPEELKKFNPKAYQIISDWAEECRNESRTKSAGSMVRKGVGVCKPGQTAASTGCTPVTGLGSKRSSSTHTSSQEDYVISPPSGKGHRQHLSYSHFNEGVKKLESVKDTATRFAKVGYEELGIPSRKALVRVWAMAKWVEHKVSVGFRKSRQVAERVAQERGMSVEGSARLAKMLGIADMVGAWTINMPATLAVTGSVTLAKVSSWVPVASLAYIGYSTARNPFAVLRAAKATLLRATEHKGLVGGNFVNDLADALEQVDDQDWLMALWCVAMDGNRDAGRALEKALGVYGSEDIPEDWELTEEDATSFNFSLESQPANRLGR